MKNTIILIVFSFSILINAQWEIIDEGVGLWGKDIEFVNDSVGWIVNWESMYKTYDGGKNWLKMNVHSNIEIGKIDFLNENLGWGIEPNSNGIYISTDGGYTWVKQKELSREPVNLCVINDSVIYAIEFRSILKTKDGGKNWNYIYNGSNTTGFSSIRFFNPDTGLVVGGANSGGIICKTYDGGDSWTVTFDTDILLFDNLQLLNDSKLYFLSLDKDETGSICVTTDLCSTWTKLTDEKYNIAKFEYFDTESICAIGIDTLWNYQLMISYDGGKTWMTKVASTPRVKCYMHFPNSSKGFVLYNVGGGFGGVLGQMIYNTIDGGDNWTIQELTYPLYSVNFLSKDLGFIAGGASEWHGGYGDVFKTFDGGKSWINTFHSANQVKSIFFINSDLGFIITNETIAGAFTKVHRTTDGGNNWDEVFSDDGDSSGFFFAGNEINFSNENIGWISGSASDIYSSGAAFLHTENGGDSWDIQWINDDGYYQYTISSSFFLNPTLGWAVGEAGLIVKYSRDQWSIQDEVTDLPLKDVFFSDEKNGWISGGYINEHNFQTILLKTTDGGEIWDENKNLPYLINDMFFEDSLNGYAVGNNKDSVSGIGSWQSEFGCGVVLKTNDGGLNWSVQEYDSKGKFTALHFNNGYGWVVGESGLVLRTSDGLTWIDQNNSKLFTSQISLSQNYPNPFNPSTTIRYAIPTPPRPSPYQGEGVRDGLFVSLKIFDILGREVETLVNKNQKPGNYEVEFSAKGGSGSDGDGSELTSGIYFYRLETQTYSETKKMVILR